MMNIFFRVAAAGELAHPRVHVITVWDLEQAVAVLETFAPSPTDVPQAAGRPARQRATVAELVRRRDAALTRELCRIDAAKRRAAVTLVRG